MTKLEAKILTGAAYTPVAGLGAYLGNEANEAIKGASDIAFFESVPGSVLLSVIGAIATVLFTRLAVDNDMRRLGLKN